MLMWLCVVVNNDKKDGGNEVDHHDDKRKTETSHKRDGFSQQGKVVRQQGQNIIYATTCVKVKKDGIKESLSAVAWRPSGPRLPGQRDGL